MEFDINNFIAGHKQHRHVFISIRLNRAICDNSKRRTVLRYIVMTWYYHICGYIYCVKRGLAFTIPALGSTHRCNKSLGDVIG